MINIIIFSFISSFVITIFLFLEESSSEKEKEVYITDYFKHFIISFIVNLLFFMIFNSIISKNIFSEPVEVGLLD